MNKVKWQIVYRSLSMLIDSYETVMACEEILEELLDEAMNEADVSGLTMSTMAAYYGAFRLLVASVRDTPGNNLASLARALMATSDLDLGGLWDVSSAMRLARYDNFFPRAVIFSDQLLRATM